MFSLGKKKYKGIMKKYLHSIILVAAFSACMSAYAQQLYRWKDQNGVAHVSDQPPPDSCTSSQCRDLREQTDSKITREKEALERKEKEARVEKERVKEFGERMDARVKVLGPIVAEENRSKIKKCFSSGGCSFGEISHELKSLAGREGQQGIVQVVGAPHKRQIIGDSGREYWYYKLGDDSIQLVWDSKSLKSINLY